MNFTETRSPALTKTVCVLSQNVPGAVEPGIVATTALSDPLIRTVNTSEPSEGCALFPPW